MAADTPAGTYADGVGDGLVHPPSSSRGPSGKGTGADCNCASPSNVRRQDRAAIELPGRGRNTRNPRMFLLDSAGQIVLLDETWQLPPDR
jgi:hypothetical protein